MRTPAIRNTRPRQMIATIGIKKQMGWACIGIFSFLSELLMPFIEGRFNMPMSPVSLLFLPLLLISCCVLLLVLVRAVKAHLNSTRTAGMLAVCSLLLVSSFAIPRAELFHRGFNQYARGVLTPEEWRSIARLAQSNLPPDGRLPGPKKNLWNENEHRALWSQFSSTTQIQKLDSHLMIFVHPGSVSIVWGGALAGHRGVTIHTSKTSATDDRKKSQDWFIAEDISTSVSAN